MPQPARPARLPRPRRRFLYGVLAVPLAMSPLATVAQEQDALPGSEPSGQDWIVSGAADDNAGAGEDVTLLTGDTVHVTTAADGAQAATVTPAPGREGTGFTTYQQGEDLYVVPTTLSALIPDTLDPGLFNVSQLLRAGYTDATSDSVPVILTYEEDARVPAAARSVDGGARELESVNGLAVALDKSQDTPEVAEALDRLATVKPGARSARSGVLAGLEKIWLDAPVQAMLDESVPQIGAPTAWDLGYDGTGVTVAVLDSGIDAEHPDVAGQVVGSANFSASDSTDDRAGHGTHVASTIAGTGAASGGRFVGVAPGASLLNGKVLDDWGNGSTSGVIDGMEWAAQSGADVVNMSLGVRGFYSDGTDPGSLAVDALTEEYDTLFVIAAGNDGPGDGTVTSPGTADLALTVGAVDGQEDIASFSSRGPRFGDHAVKPEITGPGVDIVAARAGGTAAGVVYDDNYISMSGTSMAAPHVAGAAALLAQSRPELTALERKAVLVGSAVPNEALRVLDQGAGRVNVPTALSAEAVSEPVALHLGTFSYPHEPAPVERTVTYRNLGEEPLTLDLELAAQNVEGDPASAEALSVTPDVLTVPAGGTASATVTLDPTVDGVGQFSGAVVATSGSGQALSTPVSYYKEPERYDVRVEGVARDGRPAQGSFRVLDVVDGSVSATRNWGQSDDSCTVDPWAASSCIRVEPGTYSFSGIVHTMPDHLPSTAYPGPTESYLNSSLVVEPEVTIDGPTTLTLDAREAVEVKIETPEHETRPVNGAAMNLSYHRVSQEGEGLDHGFFIGPRDQVENRLFMQPTEPVQIGEMSAYTQWTLEAPDITFEVAGEGSFGLEPFYFDPSWFSDNSSQFPRLEGEHTFEVVDVGTATPEEVAAADLDGALALVSRSEEISVGEQSNNAAGAGAAMVAVYHPTPRADGYPGSQGIQLEVPTVRLSSAEGNALRERTAQGPTTVEAVGQPASPYRYNLRLTERDAIPAELDYVLHTDDLAAVTNRFHSQLSDELTLTEAWYAQHPWETFAIAFPIPTVGGPRERVDYYVAEDGLEYLQQVDNPESRYGYTWPAEPQAQISLRNEFRTYDQGERVDRSWYDAPLRPGLWPEGAMERGADFLDIRLAGFVDGEGNVSHASDSGFEDGFDVAMRVFADGEQVIESGYAEGRLGVPGDTEEFRVEYEVDNHAPWARLSTHTSSAWTWRSTAPAEGEERVEPLLTVDYDLDVDLQNRLLAPSQRKGPRAVEFTVGHQGGAATSPIRGATLEVSYDAGESWRTIKNVRQAGGGRFVAQLPAAPKKGNDGTLSLRMTAEDAAGSTIEQEVLRAVGLPE